MVESTLWLLLHESAWTVLLLLVVRLDNRANIMTLKLVLQTDLALKLVLVLYQRLSRV